MINFKEEVLKRKDDLICDLQTLIRFKSELTTFDPNRVNAPFGESIQDALEWFLNMANKDGFNTLNVDGYAGHIILGNQETFVGSIGHLDVVPAGNGWEHDPYGAEIVGSLMYGRGTQDDKGPTLAVYYAMKILKELGVELKHAIKLILGTDEETAWRGVEYYFNKFPDAPVSGFIPDADFPLIYAEKGISRINIAVPVDASDIIEMTGGFRDNMVPDYAEVKLLPNHPYEDLFNDYLNKQNLKGDVRSERDGIILKIHGKSAHGSLPEEGVNAIDLLMRFLIDVEKSPFTKLYDRFLFDDLHGKKMNIFHQDDEMGPTTSNVGVIQIKDGKAIIYLNYRYPFGIEFKDVIQRVKDAFGEDAVTVDHHKEIIYNDPNSPLVQTLLNVYQTHTGDYESKPFSIGGGTFARAMPNVVAFGAHFLNTPSNIHQPEESIDLDDLIKATIIYTEALYRLATQ